MNPPLLSTATRYFMEVVRTGSITDAAQAVHVAPSAVSRQVAKLEESLGCPLFERQSRGMALTEAGRSFLDHARVVLADVERARQAVRPTRAVPSGEVVIGLPTTTALAATVPIVRACRERLPQVRLKVIEAYSGFLREWLQMGRLDLALLFGDEPDPDLLKRVLLEEPLALVAPPGAAALPRALRLSHLQDMELVLPGREHGLRRIIDAACAQQGIALNVVAEIDSLTSVKKAVADAHDYFSGSKEIRLNGAGLKLFITPVRSGMRIREVNFGLRVGGDQVRDYPGFQEFAHKLFEDMGVPTSS